MSIRRTVRNYDFSQQLHAMLDNYPARDFLYVAPVATGDNAGAENYYDLIRSVQRKARVYNAIDAGVDAAKRGDAVIVMPGTYSGTGSPFISITKHHIAVVGFLFSPYADDGSSSSKVPNFSGPSILPSTDDAHGIHIKAIGVRLQNLAIGHGSRTAGTPPTGGPVALRIFGEWFHVKNCNLFANFGSGIIVGPDTAANITAGKYGTGGRGVIEKNLFNSDSGDAGAGIVLRNSDYGAVTDLIIRHNHFKNIKTSHITEDLAPSPGTPCINILIHDNTHEPDEAGAAPTTFVNFPTAGTTGLVTRNSYATATNATAKFPLNVDGKLFWVANATEAGISTARPA